MKITRLSAAALCFLVIAACSSTPKLQDKPSAEFSGLSKVTGTGFSEVWARPDAGLSSYSVVSLSTMASADAEVIQPGRSAGSRIQKDWEMTQERQQSLAAAWDSAMTRAAQEGGLDTAGIGDKVLRVDAALTRIAPSADFADAQTSAGRTNVYTEDSGEASVEFRLYDQSSGELLVVIRDKRRLGAQMWQRSNTITASADAKNTLNSWAKLLVRRISGN